MSINKLPFQISLNEQIYKQIIQASRALAELNGCIDNIPNPQILINALILQEAKDSSEIENIITTHNDLYLAHAAENNISKAAKEVKDYEKALKTGYELLLKDDLILNSHILQIQSKLEQNSAGFRKLSGTTLRNEQSGQIIYTPPQNHSEILELMSNLERYMNEDLDGFDPLVKMALIHYQFESIHPFYDGNGRTGRIINILYLVHSKLLRLPVLYLSAYIVANKQKYYELFSLCQAQGDLTNWIDFMLKGVEQTALKTKEHTKNINALMDEISEILKQKAPKIYSKNLVQALFYHPYTKTTHLASELNITRQSATKYLKICEDLGICQRLQYGKNKYYVNIKLVQLFIKGIFTH